MKVPYSKEPVDFRLLILVSYINKQTWEDLVYNDIIAEYAADEIGRSLEIEEVKEKVSATLLTDTRIVVVTGQSTSQAEAKLLANKYASAICRFAPELKEIEDARIISNANHAEKVGFEDRTWAMSASGAIFGGIVSAIWLFLYFIWDTSIYIPSTTELRYGIPTLGLTTDQMRKFSIKKDDNYEFEKPRENKKTEFYRLWLQVNFLKITKGLKKIAIVDTSLTDDSHYVINLIHSILKEQRNKEISDIECGKLKKEDAYFSSPEYEIVAPGSVNNDPTIAATAAKCEATIVLIKSGDHNGKMIERALDLLRLQEANVVGAILYDVNSSLIKSYVFSTFSSSTRKLKENIYNTRNEEAGADDTYEDIPEVTETEEDK